MILPGYVNGFAPRDGTPLYPELWRGCVGAWAPCLGPTGLTLLDWSGQKNNAVLTNLTAANGWQKSGGKYAISNTSASSNHLRLNTGPCAVNDLWSYNGWFYFSTLAGSDSQPVLIHSAAGGCFAGVGSSNQMQFFSGGAWRNFTGGAVTTGIWMHLAWVRRAAASVDGYINGVSVGTLAFSPSDLVVNCVLLTRSDVPSFGLNGFADGLMIHKRPLAVSEVKLLATRRGIAYELAPRRRSSVQFVGGFKAAWVPRQRLIVGGGL